MKTIITTIAALALFAAPALATDFAVGGMQGGAVSHSTSGGIAATGGLSFPGMNGGKAIVENHQFAANVAGASGTLTFNEIDGYQPGSPGTPGNNGVGNNCQGNSCGTPATPGIDTDGIQISVDLSTYSESVQESMTRTRNLGNGTAGIGGGIALSGGVGNAVGGWKAGGYTSW